jgi:hypothetical protein
VVLVCFVFLILKPGRAVRRYRPTGTAMIAGVDEGFLSPQGHFCREEKIPFAACMMRISRGENAWNAPSPLSRTSSLIPV